MDITQFAAAIAVVIGNGVFYKLFVDRLAKMEKQYEAQMQQFREELARIYQERDEYKGLFFGMLKDSTKARRTPEMAKRIEEYEQSLRRPPQVPPEKPV